uniref:TIGR02757 family protein n=1 Tax=uncultured Elusimicrobia bacterium TaxID=699876 RepID=A0A650EPQ5_9BACT|nr:TIGR02757 family protein [uncultured Elusimicrobia bacterium]
MKKTALFLERIYALYTRPELISPDPLEFLSRYTNPADRELAALLAACFAYGNVKQIIKNINGIFAKMPRGPHAFITQTPHAKIKKIFVGFRYRFTGEEELCALLAALRRVIKEHGSLENCFLCYYKEENETVLPALRAFARELREGADLHSLIPDPDKNSALKRLNLFLRWMVRQDAVDPGGWTRVSPAKLIVPVDVHMHRIARKLGLTKRNAADITTALEISRAFKKCCPHDPIKYDFCLTRFGIRDDMNYKNLDDLK